MSNKKILNLTSRKKRNTMLTYSNTTVQGQSKTVGVGNAYVSGNQQGSFLWLATAQDLTDGSARGTVSTPAQRSATSCYMRGLNEHIRIQTSSGVPWFHRRLCFTFKGQKPFTAFVTETPPVAQPATPYLEAGGGMQRLFFNQTINGMPTTLTERYAVLFKGEANVDWNDVLIAQVDTTRVSLKFDKTWTIKSGNANGTVAERKLWHPMNKTLVYDDDESGASEVSSYNSVGSKAGMGDFYVLDIIVPGEGGTSTDFLSITSSSTLYWHER